MSTARITIDQAGTNHLSINGSPTTAVPGTGQDAQTNAMNHLRQHAAQTQETVALHVQDNDGTTYNLRVAPDGQVWSAPPTQPEPAQLGTPVPGEQESAPLTIPRVDQTMPSDPIVTEVPGAQHVPDVEPTRPRHVAPTPAPLPTSEPPMPSSPAVAQPVSPAPPMPQPGPDALQSQPAPGPDPVERDPRWSEIAQRPAEEGFRGTLNGMGLKLGPTEDELEQRRERLREEIAREELERAAEEERARTEAAQQTRRATRAREEAQRDREQRDLIQTNFQGTKTILVANPKGGSRKTTSTYALAATMGTIRGGSVIAWDANETMGTLGERARQDRHHRTVVDLLEQAAPSFDSVDGIRLGALDSYVRPQGDSHFDVLASDEDPERQDIVDGPTFGVVHEILGRFYRVVLVDTGNNIRVGHFQAALDAAHQLVIPVAASRDSAKAARKMMRAFVTDGHEELVSSAVVLLHDIERAEAATPDYLEVVQSIAEEFTPLVSEVIAVPYDNALKDGDTIEFADLSESSHTSYRRAAAAIASSLLRHT